VYALLLFSLVIVSYILFCIVIVFVGLYGLYVRVSPCTGNLPFVSKFFEERGGFLQGFSRLALATCSCRFYDSACVVQLVTHGKNCQST